MFGKEDMKLVSLTNVFGVDPADPNGADDVQVLNEIHVPIGKPVIIYVSSKDVIHSLKIIAMRVCQDAIPGLRIPCWFTPTIPGRYQINCAQLCGFGHANMTQGFLTVESQEDFDKWLKSKANKKIISAE
jgi:cytochrome c oxidase subunit 2